MVVVLLSCGRAIVLCYPGLGQICDCSKVKKIKSCPVWCGGVVVVVWWWWWCGFITDNNTTLRLHWVTLGCGDEVCDTRLFRLDRMKNVVHSSSVSFFSFGN